MREPIDDQPRRQSALPDQVTDTVDAIRVDLKWLHQAWVDVLFSPGYSGDHSVVERREPESTGGMVAYRLWGALGILALIFVGYPLFVLGLATRYYARRIDRWTAGLGFVGIALVSLGVWGLFSLATFLSPIAFEGFLAVVLASLVASASAVLARFFSQTGGRRSTIALAYPFGVTALFLPPVVASLYSPTLAAVVFPGSESIAIWILDTLLAVGGLNSAIRATFDLQGLAYVGMWFVIAVPIGWALGLLVTAVTNVRETGHLRARTGPESDLYR